MTQTTAQDLAAIVDGLSTLHPAGDVFEIRMFDVQKPNGYVVSSIAGYFDDPAKAAKAIRPYVGRVTLYQTMNRINPALLARAHNRLIERPKSTTSDADVTRRLWLPIDTDPERPSLISATDEELAAALALRDEIVAYLANDWGWQAAIEAISGNGGHALYRLDLPNDDESLRLVQGVLNHLAERFDDELVKVDTSVHTAGRVWKVYGTVACKGDSLPDRPHRLAEITYHDPDAPVIGADLLRALVPVSSPGERKRTARQARAGGYTEEDMSGALDRLGVDYSTKTDTKGRTIFALGDCLTSDAHSDGAAITLEDGKAGYVCHHNSCSAKTWQDVKRLLFPQAHTNGQGPETGTGARPAGPDGEPPKGWTVALANAICETEHFAKSEGGELHYYDDGRYRRGGKEHVKRLCKRTLVAWGREGTFTSYRANEVTAYIAADAPILWNQPPGDRLNVKNGILDLHTRELQPHTPTWLSTIQLPVEYDPEAEPHDWVRFIRDWFPDDAQETPWELLAWLMRPDLALQKAGLLLGNGENGKSRFLAAFKAFLGAHNVAALSLQQIETSRWATHHLNGKLANICPDLPAQHLETSSMFKAITGGDMVPAEKKHGEMYEYQPFVRLLFSANQPPQSNDASRAFFRRWLVIPFDATFTPAEKLPEAEIDRRLARPEELSGALNRALDVLPDVQRLGITETPSMREAHREFHEVTDPVEVWLETNTVERPGAYVVKGDLCKAYNEAARANGWPVLVNSQFGKRVKDWRPHLDDGQKTFDNGRRWVWKGIGLQKRDESG